MSHPVGRPRNCPFLPLHFPLRYQSESTLCIWLFGPASCVVNRAPWGWETNRSHGSLARRDLIKGTPGNGYPLQYSCLEIPQTEEPSGLQSILSKSVRQDWSYWAGTHALFAKTWKFKNRFEGTYVKMVTVVHSRRWDYGWWLIFFFICIQHFYIKKMNDLHMVTAAIKSKDSCSLKEKLWPI